MNPSVYQVKTDTESLFQCFGQFWEVGPVAPSIELSCRSFPLGKELAQRPQSLP